MLYFLGLHTIIDRLYGAYDACLLIAGGWAGAMPYWFGTRTRNCVSRSRACPNPRLTNTPDIAMHERESLAESARGSPTGGRMHRSVAT